MWSLRAFTWLGAAGALALSSCHTASREEVAETESQQVISESLKKLYMACSAAPRQSAAQQKLVLHMAEQASNGKELLLVMRAGMDVFPDSQSPPGQYPAQPAEGRLRSLVAAKMMRVATLHQLIEYARLYPINPEDSQPYAQRMLQFAEQNRDPRIWYGIRVAAYHLKMGDLERQAKAKEDELATK